MSDYLDWVYTWLVDNVFAVIQNTHNIFWNGNVLFFTTYVVGLIVLFNSNGENQKAKKLFAMFSVVAMLVFCYNPFVYTLFLKMPSSDDAVFSRIWIIIPVWMVIAFAGTELIGRIKSKYTKNGLYLLLGVGIIMYGYTSNYYIDPLSSYKVNNDGIEIADTVLSLADEDYPEMLLCCNIQEYSGNFVQGGTVWYGIAQYTGKIGITSVYLDEQTWNSWLQAEELTGGETTTMDCLIGFFDYYHRFYDFSYVVMPQADSFREIMPIIGYKYVTSTEKSDIYEAESRWWVHSLSFLLEDGNKIYVLSDSTGHYLVVGGGSISDIEQLQKVMIYCGNHVDAWIMPCPSAENLEGFNYIVTTEGNVVDKVYLPAVNIDELPSGIMDDQDLAAYEELVNLSETELCELNYLAEGDEINLFDMSFKVFSDMLNITSGSIEDNSMLFRMQAGNKSFLFCSYIGHEQGQSALQKYGNALDSDYVQIASGTGDGLGLEFYNAVSPDIAFCDYINDEAGKQTYDLLSASGITCYCIENGDPNVVMIKDEYD